MKNRINKYIEYRLKSIMMHEEDVHSIPANAIGISITSNILKGDYAYNAVRVSWLEPVEKRVP